jgi:large subunit ribosomal protein L6
MSRIGKKPIKLNSAQVEQQGNKIVVNGPKGTLNVPLFKGIDIEINADEVTVLNKKDTAALYPKWGLVRSLLQNAITGVTEGFEKRLEMIGVGFRANKSSDGVTIHAGYSHPINFKAPEGIELNVEENTKIIVRGFDKHKVGQVAANIRKIRKPEPYKGKGIKYADEVVRRKAGKAGKA